MTRLPYYSYRTVADRGESSLYHRLCDVFGLDREADLADHTQLCSALAGAPFNVMRIDQANSGSTEVIEIYVDLMYQWMLFAWTRVVAYENAIFGALRARPDLRRSLEIGCGRYPILSRMLYEAGVPDLTICEVKRDSLRSATAHFARLVGSVHEEHDVAVVHGDDQRVVLHNRYSTELDLAPDETFDLYVHEILGSIGSMQGCVDVFNQTLPLLSADAVVVPARSRSLCAPTMRFEIGRDDRARRDAVRAIDALAGSVIDDPAFEPGAFYAVTNLPRSAFMAEPQPFEDFDYAGLEPLPLQNRVELEFLPNTEAGFDGLTFYLELHTDADNVFSIVDEQTSWPPLYARVFDAPIPVHPERHRIRVVADYDCSIEGMYYAFDVSVVDGETTVARRTVRLQLS